MTNKPLKHKPFIDDLTPEERLQVEQRARAIWKARKDDGKITAEDDWYEAIAQLQQEYDLAEKEGAFPGKWVKDQASSIRKMLGLESKTPWDLFQALMVPITLVVIGSVVQDFAKRRDSEQQEVRRQQDQQLADDKARQETLVRYLAEMSDLLEKGLLRSPQDSERVIIAQAKTVTALQSLNPERRYQVLQFLKAANLNKLNQYGLLHQARMSKSNFSGSDLSGAVMIGADLQQAKFDCLFPDKTRWVEKQCSDLSGVNLEGATLFLADLSGAELERVNFTNARVMLSNFTDASLGEATFAGASLDRAVLQNAILLGANLSTSRYLTQAQLDGPNPPFLCGTKLPADLASLSNRDCDARLPAELMRRNPDVYPTLDTAKQSVEIFR